MADVAGSRWLKRPLQACAALELLRCKSSTSNGINATAAHLPGNGTFSGATPCRMYATTPLRARLLGGGCTRRAMGYTHGECRRALLLINQQRICWGMGLSLRYAMPHVHNNALTGAAIGRGAEPALFRRALLLINQQRICRGMGLFLALRRAAYMQQRPYGRGYWAGAAQGAPWVTPMASAGARCC